MIFIDEQIFFFSLVQEKDAASVRDYLNLLSLWNLVRQKDSMDYQGQKLSENIYYILTILFGVRKR